MTLHFETIAAVPEPRSVALLAGAAVMIVACRRRLVG